MRKKTADSNPAHASNEQQLVKTLEKISTSLATIASAVNRLEQRDRMKHDAQVGELEAREKFHKGQTEMLEKTNTLFKNPKLEEYLHSLSTMVRDLGPEGMRKMTDASFIYTQDMLKSQKEFDSILGRKAMPTNSGHEDVEISIPTPQELDNALNDAARTVLNKMANSEKKEVKEEEKDKSEQ